MAVVWEGISWYFTEWMLETDGLAWITNFPFLWRNNFPSSPQSVLIPNLWWHSSPKIRHHAKHLQTTSGHWTLKDPTFKSNVTWPKGSILFQLAHDSCMPAQGCNFSVHFFLNSSSYIWFCGTFVQNADILFSLIIVQVSCPFLTCMCLDHFLGAFYSEIRVVCWDVFCLIWRSENFHLLSR